MIFTITPNPALDLGGTIKRLLKNEKNYVFNETRFPGGNGINSARIAHRLGARVVASGFLGGSVGEEVKRLLEREHLRHDFVTISGNTRINLTVSKAKSHEQTRLSFPGPKISRSELEELHKVVRKLKSSSLLVIGGSLPQGISERDIQLVVTRARKRGIFTIVDMPGPSLKAVIPAGPLLIKPNLREFQELTNTKVKSINAVVAQAKKLTRKIHLICVSSVEGGAVLVSQNKAWYGRIPKVKVKSTVGAGDSMVGAMSEMLVKREINKLGADELASNLESIGCELLRWGLAAACATLMESGTQLGSKRSIVKYYSKISVSEL